MSNTTYTKQAIVDLVDAIKGVFKKYTRQVREKSWKKLTGKQGQEEMDKVIRNLARPTSRFRILQFAEWIETREKKQS